MPCAFYLKGSTPFNFFAGAASEFRPLFQTMICSLRLVSTSSSLMTIDGGLGIPSKWDPVSCWVETGEGRGTWHSNRKGELAFVKIPVWQDCVGVCQFQAHFRRNTYLLTLDTDEKECSQFLAVSIDSSDCLLMLQEIHFSMAEVLNFQKNSRVSQTLCGIAY